MQIVCLAFILSFNVKLMLFSGTLQVKTGKLVWVRFDANTSSKRAWNSSLNSIAKVAIGTRDMAFYTAQKDLPGKPSHRAGHLQRHADAAPGKYFTKFNASVSLGADAEGRVRIVRMPVVFFVEP